MGLFKNRGWEAIIADDLISNGKKHIDVTFHVSGYMLIILLHALSFLLPESLRRFDMCCHWIWTWSWSRTVVCQRTIHF